MKHYGFELGEKAVRIAREVLDTYITTGNVPEIKDYPGEFNNNGGAFVTLKTWPDHNLRGCIGYPEPIFPLIKAIVDNAINASTEDPRFPPVKPGELDHIVVEVSLLTPPEEIEFTDPRELPQKIKVGRDGLIVERGGFRGLLLPQVPVEEGWDETTFLEHTCWKAGLPMDCWLRKGTRFYAFQAEVYAEETPRGKVIEIPLQ